MENIELRPRRKKKTIKHQFSFACPCVRCKWVVMYIHRKPDIK